MYEIDFNKPLHIHFIGIGGISMSGLAEILLKEDFKISGSDAKPSDLVTHLESLGAKVYIGQRASNITDDIELVIYTAAIHRIIRNLPVQKKNRFQCSQEQNCLVRLCATMKLQLPFPEHMERQLQLP